MTSTCVSLRWFWVKQGEGAELACFDLDAGIDHRGAWLGRKAWYLCNQMIYSPCRRGAGRVRSREISVDHPLRWVVFEESLENPSVREWQARMEKDLVLKETKVYRVPVSLGEGQPAIEQWRVCEFVPRPAGSTDRITVQQPMDQRRR